MSHNFFALLSRMKYIVRWSLMRNTKEESLSEHSLDVAMIAHALCVIGNNRYGRGINAEKAALVALYHDASEIITGDMPTPIKYHNERIKQAYKDIEFMAEDRLLEHLPADMRPDYEEIFNPERLKGVDTAGFEAELPDTFDATADELISDAMRWSDEKREWYMRALVKGADKLSALIKCMEEESAGNNEFSRAKKSTTDSIEKLVRKFPEIYDFTSEFLASYGKTLDELTGIGDAQS